MKIREIVELDPNHPEINREERIKVSRKEAAKKKTSKTIGINMKAAMTDKL